MLAAELSVGKDSGKLHGAVHGLCKPCNCLCKCAKNNKLPEPDTVNSTVYLNRALNRVPTQCDTHLVAKCERRERSALPAQHTGNYTVLCLTVSLTVSCQYHLRIDPDPIFALFGSFFLDMTASTTTQASEKLFFTLSHF